MIYKLMPQKGFIQLLPYANDNIILKKKAKEITNFFISQSNYYWLITKS